MNSERLINTGVKGTFPQNISEGPCFISSKLSEKDFITISHQSNNKINLAQKSFDSNQCFIIKFNSDDNYYTIMSLYSHQFLGVPKTNDFNHSIISQYPDAPDYLIQWQIDLNDDAYFIFQLKDTEYYLDFGGYPNSLILNRKRDKDGQKFKIYSFPVIQTGLYIISPKNSTNLALNFLPNSQIDISSYDKTKKSQIVFIQFDPHDGYHSIINFNNLDCLTVTDENQISQKSFFNYDSQKVVIGVFDLSKGEFFIETKTSQLRLTLSKKRTKDSIPFVLEPFDRNNDDQIFELFQFKNANKEQFNKASSTIQKKVEWRYEQQIDIDLKINKINDDLFSNNFKLQILTIPLSVTNISENAFKNCKRIKAVSCDPKWLKLFPNPLNIENIIVPDGVTKIEDDSFQRFLNLKYLRLPSSLSIQNCNPNAFKELYNILEYEGDPIFLKLIHKITLKIAIIPSYVKEIPEEAFAGCSHLIEVEIGQNSQLKIIRSRAFANCEILETFKVPKTVENIAPNAFHGCNKDFKLELTDEKQKLSMVESLILDPDLQRIGDEYKLCCNIESIEISIVTTECEPGVLNSFKYLKFVKCDPMWLNSFLTYNIEMVFIPDGVIQIRQDDFENLIHLKFLEIPETVEYIDEFAFENCNQLTSVKCGSQHLPYLNHKRIKTLILDNSVQEIHRSYFEAFVNLESIVLPETIKNVGLNVFANCKKLAMINNSAIENFINNKISIDESRTIILKEEFENWSNLQSLEIPKSIETIEKGAFDDCINLKILKCDPKWFPFIPKNNIRTLIIPSYITQLKRGDFDEFYSLSSIYLPENVQVDDPRIFDQCENLIMIRGSTSIYKNLSQKTKERCKECKPPKYVKPVYDFQPDKSRVHDQTINRNKRFDLNEDLFFSKSVKHPKETTIEDIVRFDPSLRRLKIYINQVLSYALSGEVQVTKPMNTSLNEITKLCGSICYKIHETFNIVPRPVQILAILSLADDILNNKDSHGAIGEIKTGEGKSLIITILCIILVKYQRTVDVVTSNLELAKRDQKEQSKYFHLFHITTAVLYHRTSDIEFMSNSMNFSSSGIDPAFKNFNLKAFQYPVVYSTNSNFEFVYLYSIFNMSPRTRPFDVVLVDEVDSMFIDESDSPAIISKDVNFAFSRDIFQIVFLLHTWKTSEIIKILKYYLPNASEFKEESIEVLKNAALIAVNKTKDVDYIIENDQIVIIDRNTGFKRLGSRWRGYIHEMIEIKEGFEPKSPSVSFCQITQHGYFNLYKKIAGVTGTIGNKGDEELLKSGYNVNIFKVPRHYASQMDVFLKKRPNSLSDIFSMVSNEINEVTEQKRPVLVIWDSIYQAEKFLEEKNFPYAQKIIGKDPSEDRESIQNAGITETVTIATAAAGRGVDIKLTNEAIEAGGLHVIIPMQMPNQRALEQAAGRSGRQGQPGSVSIYTSDEDKYVKTPEFKKAYDNLVKLELRFSNYLNNYFSWMKGPMRYGFREDPIFPYASDYKVALTILARCISFFINQNPIALGIHYKTLVEGFKNLALETSQLAWSIFFSNLWNNPDKCDDFTYCERMYDDFINELNNWFHPTKSKTIEKAMWYIRFQLMKEMDLECVIVNGIKIASYVLCVVFPEAAPTIRLINGTVLAGGLEIYHQLQNGDKVNWAQVLICAGGGAVRSIINDKCGPFKKIALYGLDLSEGVLYGMAEAFANDKEKPEFPQLPMNLKGFGQETGKWLAELIKEKQGKKAFRPKKPKMRIKPKIRVPQLEVEFIRKSMSLADSAYSGDFETGEVVFSCEINEKYKPKFYCLEESDDLYVVIRGSKSKVDWLTDFDCQEVKHEIDGSYIYFHNGFYNAANYILSKVDHFLNKEYKTIYFVGHSYAAAVSSVLCVLTKTQNKFKNKKIFTMAFAPAPSMSRCPSTVSDCIFAFINRNDIVPHMSLYNLLNTVRIYDTNCDLYVNSCKKILNLCKNEWAKALVLAIEICIGEIIDNIHIESLHVRKVKGTLFGIGMCTATQLDDCRLIELDLPNTLVLTVTSANDHFMSNYIENFKKIEI